MGARIVALDVLMTEADQDDALLASAMRQGLPTVLPLMVRFGGAIREELPVPPLAKSAAAIGHVNVDVDPDGMVRSLFLKEGLGSPIRPYLADALLGQMASGMVQLKCAAKHPDLQHAPGDVWVRDCQTLIPYSGPPGHFTRVSYADVLAGRVSDAAIRDKIVLVGATAQGIGDAWSTPVSGGALAMPGVEIMANVLAAQRNGTLIRKIPLVPTIILTLLPVYLLGVALRVLAPPLVNDVRHSNLAGNARRVVPRLTTRPLVVGAQCRLVGNPRALSAMELAPPGGNAVIHGRRIRSPGRRRAPAPCGLTTVRNSDDGAHQPVPLAVPVPGSHGSPHRPPALSHAIPARRAPTPGRHNQRPPRCHPGSRH